MANPPQPFTRAVSGKSLLTNFVLAFACMLLVGGSVFANTQDATTQDATITGTKQADNTAPTPGQSHPRLRSLTGCLKRISGTDKYWLVNKGGLQWVVRSDDIDLSVYVNEAVKVSAVKADSPRLPAEFIVSNLTTTSDSCAPNK